MEEIMTITATLVIMIIGLVFIISNMNKNKNIFFVDWAILAIIGIYGFCFSLVYISTVNGNNPSAYKNYIIQFSVFEILYYFIIVFLLIISIKIGWATIKIQEKNSTVQVMDNIRIKTIRKHTTFAWCMLIISIISYYLFARAYGGFYGLLSNTIALRSGVSTTYNKYSFFEKFGQFSVISAYVFFALFMDKIDKNPYKKKILLGLIISLLFSIYFLYSRGGRGNLMFFILTLILMSSYYSADKISKFLKTNGKYFILLPLSFILMNDLWSRTDNIGYFTLFITSISYPFAAFIVNFNNKSYRLFKDFFQSVFYFFPSSIWQSKFGFKTTNAVTTFLISGAYKGEKIGDKILTGTTPNDLLTFSYMQAGLFGVIVVGIFFGMFLKYFHNKISKENHKGLQSMLYSYFIVQFIIRLFLYGDPSNVIITNWGFIIYFMFFNMYKKIKIK